MGAARTILAAGVLFLAAAAPAHAALTFGSDLTLPTDPAANSCSFTPGQVCTWVPNYYRDANAHGVEAPIDGVVVRFRAKSAKAEPVTFRLTVVQRSLISAAAVGTGPSVTLSGGDAVDTFPTRLRARKGTHVGLDTGAQSNAFSKDTVIAGSFGWTPWIVDRAPARGNAKDQAIEDNSELLVNADIEPDADRDGYGDETQDPDPKNARVPDVGAKRPPCGDVDLVGSNGADELIGGRLRENALGLGGADKVFGGEEADCVDGGAGNDQVNGNGNADRVTGGAGNDKLWGGDRYNKVGLPYNEPDGDDVLDGGAGADQIIGAGGNDLIRGGAGGDDLYADYTPKGLAPASKDRIFGDSGNDSLTGSRGNEVLDGGSGRDDLNGNGGRDSYSGGSGNDTIVSADGRKERVVCGAGSRDTVIADKNDKVASDCENVQRRQ